MSHKKKSVTRNVVCIKSQKFLCFGHIQWNHVDFSIFIKRQTFSCQDYDALTYQQNLSPFDLILMQYWSEYPRIW